MFSKERMSGSFSDLPLLFLLLSALKNLSEKGTSVIDNPYRPLKGVHP